MEKTYAHIKDELDRILYSQTTNYSLYTGKMGICISYFILAKKDNSNSDYFFAANKILDDLGDEITNVELLGFANGLAGIGWGIEWLAQNKFINVNTDDILEDLDNVLYKTIVYSKSKCLCLETGTIGKALYFYRRLIAVNPSPNRFRLICIHECLILLTDEIADRLTDFESGLISAYNINNSIQLAPENIYDISQSLVLIIKLIPHKVNLEVLESLVCKIVSFIENYSLSYQSGNNEALDIAHSYQLYAFYLTGISFNDKKYIRSSTSLFKEHFRAISTSVNDPLITYIHSEISNLPCGHDGVCHEVMFPISENYILNWLVNYNYLFDLESHSIAECMLLK